LKWAGTFNRVGSPPQPGTPDEYLPLLLAISRVSPHLVRQSILVPKIEPDVGGGIDDLERRLHQADHVQAAESPRQAAKLIFLTGVRQHGGKPTNDVEEPREE
jgi:hypothetical protein